MATTTMARTTRRKTAVTRKRSVFRKVSPRKRPATRKVAGAAKPTKARNVFSVRASLDAIIYREGGGYVSCCPALGVYSEGDTKKEARENIIEATELLIDYCLEKNILEKVLKERGFHPVHQRTKGRKPKLPGAPAGVACQTIKIPSEFPILAR